MLTNIDLQQALGKTQHACTISIQRGVVMRMDRLTKPTVAGIVVFSALVFSSLSHAGYNIKIAHASPAINDRLEESLKIFKENVEKRTGKEVVVTTYPASQLGGEREILEGVQLGSIEMAVLAGPIPGIYPKIMVFDLPFLFNDEDIAYDVLDGDFGQKILDGLLAETGIRGLAWGENGFRHFTNNVRPIVEPQDVSGLKIRTMENPAHMAMVESLGANPTPMAFGEVYSALQQGVIDGQENPISLIESMRFYEVQKYLTLDGHVYNPFAFIVNENFFASMPEEFREIIQEEALNWSNIEREINREQVGQGLEKLEDGGMTIRDLSDEEKSVFRAATQPVYDEYRKILGDEIIDDLIEAVRIAEEASR